ncbi:IclR family transcriptional regulator [Burkholderia multivorans]|uniref:IclR family transcriptional regulator n=1 Tax=Burkholderia multivorans TaxID=87883 RepID=UPI0021BE6E4E|nr:IclR family transcriptional regulator [Burkholderia multivorans]
MESTVSSMAAVLEDNLANDSASVIGKTKAVVEALAVRGALSLTAVARSSGVPKTTAHRILTQLCEWGIVEREQKGFVLGQRLTTLALRAQRNGNLLAVGRPYVADFFAATRVTTALFVQDSPTTVRCVEKIYGPNEPSGSGDPGTCAPMHCTAAGKVMLAFGNSTMTHIPARLTQHTPRTIKDPNLLRRELSLIRHSGYAVDGEEWHLGLCAVAVPIIGRNQQILGALSCGGKSAVADWTEGTMEQVRKIADGMKHQARLIALAVEGHVQNLDAGDLADQHRLYVRSSLPDGIAMAGRAH